MRVDIVLHEEKIRFFIVTLCSYGDTADFEAFPSKELTLDLHSLGTRLKHSGYKEVRTDGTRLKLTHGTSDIMIFKNGRMILEHISPPLQSSAAEIVTSFSTLF